MRQTSQYTTLAAPNKRHTSVPTPGLKRLWANRLVRKGTLFLLLTIQGCSITPTRLVEPGTKTVTQQDLTLIAEERFTTTYPKTKIKKIGPTLVPGMYEIQTRPGKTIYFHTESGSIFFGSIVEQASPPGTTAGREVYQGIYCVKKGEDVYYVAPQTGTWLLGEFWKGGESITINQHATKECTVLGD